MQIHSGSTAIDPVYTRVLPRDEAIISSRTSEQYPYRLGYDSIHTFNTRIRRGVKW